jgi:hypothetical protein
MRTLAMALRVAGNDKGEGGMAMAMVTRMAGKQRRWDKEGWRARMRAIVRGARVMAMAMKRAITRKRAMASDDDNKTKATETRTMTTTTMAMNSTMTTMMLTMATKKRTKTTTTTVRWQRLVVAGGGGGGQQRRRWRGLSVYIFLSKLNSGCCWLLARGR